MFEILLFFELHLLFFFSSEGGSISNKYICGNGSNS